VLRSAGGVAHELINEAGGCSAVFQTAMPTFGPHRLDTSRVYPPYASTQQKVQFWRSQFGLVGRPPSWLMNFLAA
jgi:hypothetical protein